MLGFTHFQTFPKIPKKSLKIVKSSYLGTKSLKARAVTSSEKKVVRVSYHVTQQ